MSVGNIAEPSDEGRAQATVPTGDWSAPRTSSRARSTVTSRSEVLESRARPASVRLTLRVERLINTTPRFFSSRVSCLLTADRLTPICRAASVKLSVDAIFLNT